MKNKLNQKMLNYAINKFKEALNNDDYSDVCDGVCQVLWSKFGYPHKDVSEISIIGRGYISNVTKKYNLKTGNMWWFFSENKKTLATARLEVLKLLKENE